MAQIRLPRSSSPLAPVVSPVTPRAAAGAGRSAAMPRKPGILGLVLRWLDRSTQRGRLQELDDRLLQDIGVSREDALAEAKRPFWM